MASNRVPQLPSLMLNGTRDPNQLHCMELIRDLRTKLQDTYANDTKVKENARKIGIYLFGRGSKDIISEFSPDIIELINKIKTALTVHSRMSLEMLHAYSEIFDLPLRKGGKKRQTRRRHKRRLARKTRVRKN